MTLFRGNHMPFAVRLNLDYSKFTLNIEPHETHLAPGMVSALLKDKTRLWSMKAALAEVQAQFLWVNTTQYSVFGRLEEELALIANI